ncbi:MAG TPA: glycosyltransferase [Ramlibacter sp.]|nr:glycosyltransferase [Ramlibacter sp.]
MTQALPVVHVLLATYNGGRFLREQWESLEAQQGVGVVVHVADDGSSDGTVRLVEQLAECRRGAVQQVHWLHAPPRRSATRSFLLLLARTVESCPEAAWFAYCDQDDVWLPGKLSAALAALMPHSGDARAALYGGRTLAVHDDGREGGLSPLFVRPPSFRNAITQNIMGGNTMVMNRAAAMLVARSAHLEVVTHDWYTYQLVSGAEGFISYDPRPFVRYRQHEGNVIGSNLGWRARWDRLLRMLRGEYRVWNALNVAALEQCAPALTPGNRAVLDAFRRARAEATPWARMAWLRRSGAFRQKPSEQAMLWIACILRRL